MLFELFSREVAASCGAPFFLRRLLCALLLGWTVGCRAADDVAVRPVVGSDFQATREALVEAIEAEGLVVSALIPFNRMLARTAGALEQSASPYAEAEIVQFCSSAVAWQMIGEEVGQLALCPLSIAVYSTAADPGQVVLAYRLPGQATPARLRADELLRRLVERAGQLARLRW